MNIRIYKPEIFQGDLKKKNYFEGWYFKHVSKDLEQIYSFIPGISLNEDDSHAFIQVINGITGETEYISYPLQEFIWDKKRLYLKVGRSVFTDKYIDLNIENKNLNVTGYLEYVNIVKYPKSLLSPGIMGWYSFVPFMECKHGVVSVNHDLSGSIRINDKLIYFDGGKGYIEKDWGTSFPEAWLWAQANNFQDHATSFCFSAAKIPWRGKFFIGFVAFLYHNKEFFLFSTYNSSVISGISHSGESIKFTLNHHSTILKVIITKKTFGVLRAPSQGNMSRRIKESIDSQIELSLFDNNYNLIFNDVSSRAGLEVTDKIFDYLESGQGSGVFTP
jgi:hypothetical protein